MIPEINHIQYLVLELLLRGELAGKELRDQLDANGCRKSGPAFYQFMSRLEDCKFVDGWYDQKVIAGQHIKERRYKITGRGVSAIDDVRSFYAERKSKNLGIIGI